MPLVFGLILVILQVVGGKKNKGIKTLFGLLLCISFVASFIILIDAANVAKLTGSVLGFSGTSSFADAGYKLAWGAIVEIVLAGIGFVSSCAYTLYSAK